MQRGSRNMAALAAIVLVQLAVASAATPAVFINLPHKIAPVPAPAPSAHTPSPLQAQIVLPRKQAPAVAPANAAASRKLAPMPAAVPAPIPAPVPALVSAPKMAPAPAPTAEAPVASPAVPQAAETAVQATLQLIGSDILPFDQDKAAMLIRALAQTLTSVNPASINVLSVAASSNSRRLMQSNAATVVVELAGASHMSAADIIANLQTVISNGSLLKALQTQGLDLSQVQIVVADPTAASSNTVNCPYGAVSSVCLDGSNGSSGISTAAVIGIAIGGGIAVVFTVALTALLAYWCCMRRERSTPTPSSVASGKDIPMAQKEVSGPGTTSTSWFRRTRRTTTATEEQSSCAFPSVDSSVFPDASGLQRNQNKGVQLARRDSGDMLEDAFQLVFGNKDMKSPFDSDSCSESEKLRRDSGHASEEALDRREQHMETADSSSSSLPSAVSLK